MTMRRLVILLILFFMTISQAWGDKAETLALNNNADWLDRSHGALSLRTQKAARWFDRFFGDRRDQDEEATMRTRITFGWESNQHEENNTYARIRIKIKLPNLKNRFDLLISNEEVDNFNLLPLEANRPQQVSDTTESNYDAALRWIKRTTVKETIDARVGLRSGPNIYLLGRHCRQHNFTPDVKLRLTPAVFLDSKYGVGGRLLTELDYLFEHPALIRLSGRGQFTDKTNGLEWRGGLSYMYRLSSKGAIVSGFYLSGETDENDDAEKYSVSVRLRNQLWRSYLFYEIEPFIDWLATENYRSNIGVALRLGVVIGQ